MREDAVTEPDKYCIVDNESGYTIKFHTDVTDRDVVVYKGSYMQCFLKKMELKYGNKK